MQFQKNETDLLLISPVCELRKTEDKKRTISAWRRIVHHVFDAMVYAHCCVRDEDDVTPIQWLIGLGLALGLLGYGWGARVGVSD